MYTQHIHFYNGLKGKTTQSVSIAFQLEYKVEILSQ